MNGNIAIDFRPSGEAMPRILGTIEGAGFPLCGLHLVPSCADRATLMIDLGRLDRAQLAALETKLEAIGGVIAVIHTACPRGDVESARGAGGARAAA